MVYPDKNHLIETLQQIAVRWESDMPETSKSRIKFLNRDFEFLHIFLSLQSFTDLSDKLDVTHKVQALFQDSAIDLIKVSKINHVDRVISRIHEKILITKLEIRAIQLVLSNKDGIHTPKFVIEFIDTVILNLAEFVGELGDVFKELKLLRSFVCFVSERSIEPKSQHVFFTHVLDVVGRAAMIAWLYFPSNGGCENQEMNNLLSDLLQMKIKPIHPGVRKIYIDVLQAVRHPIIQIENAADCVAGFVETLQHNLKEVPTICNPSRIVASIDQIAVLEEMLGLLIKNLVQLSIQNLEFHLQDIDAVVVDSGLLVYSLYEDVALQEVTLDLPGIIQRIKRLIYLIIRKEFQSSLPRIHGIGYVDFVLNNLKELQERYPVALAYVKTQLQMIQTVLDGFRSILRFVAEKRHKKLQNSVALLISKAYEVEYIVDGCVSNKVPDWCLMLWLLELIEEIRAELAKIPVLEDDSVSHDPMDIGTSHTSSVLARTLRIDDEIVGFEDEIGTLIRQLTGGSKKRDIISIVGMPGAGKTALANRLFLDKSVVRHFDVHARCYMSSAHSRRERLLSILEMLHVSIDESSLLSKKTNDLAAMLRKILHTGRYLILLDDVPDARAWDDLEPCFCDTNNGSRILLTTRHYNVANNVKLLSEPLCLRMLDDGESWMLLKKKVFGEGFCSPLLEKVGRKIARKCGGLPLSIVFVACILARKERAEQCWKQVARSLGSEIPCYPENIIEQSYQDLPYHLKSCFLYFGMFSDQEEINISKLTLLWIGEGFVKGDEHKSLEDIAEGYLKNLVESNLVMLAKRSYGGKVKVCRIHDILFHFCKARAHTENLIQRIQRPQGYVYSPKQLAQRRLAFYAEVDDLVKWSSSCSLVSSVLFREANTDASSSIAQAADMFHDFRFLRVLDLEFTMIDSFPTDMVYLRYFAARTSQESISSSIDKLWNLETLIVNRIEGYLSVPFTIWKVGKLRHLHVSPYFTSEELLEDSSKLYNLGTLSTPYFSCVEDAESLLRKTPNIRELRCKFKGMRSGQFPVLEFPTQLEVLDIFGDQSVKVLPYLICISASNLKKLKVSFFKLGVQHLSNIYRLPNIQTLELTSVEFENEEWKVDDELFQLKVLKLVNCLSLKEWTASDDALPNLEHLVVHCCQLLTKIPSCFTEICSLKYIEVDNCNESVVDSAKFIQETKVEDYQNNDFELVIKDHNSGHYTLGIYLVRTKCSSQNAHPKSRGCNGCKLSRILKKYNFFRKFHILIISCYIFLYELPRSIY
ncbi:putative late blight resistance protein homolog R1A-3 isoform X2 [Capsicum annuum]|uniref:putative late blight resistance protein homolog R1A-3 isoform X2 n=1 Tax=Capsicum annuum TaxID=4072 RepID=UPI001FB09098|nr:putative late blight resistance protein homolog R1A-3 isoform X2 [Capsicum annuum]